MKKSSLMLACVALSASVVTHADTDYFFDGVFGQTDQKNSLDGFDVITATDSAKGFRAGFYLNPQLGVEFVSMDYGVAEDSFVDGMGETVTNTLDTQMAGVGLQGVIPLSHKVKLTGRLGIAAWKLKFTSGVPGDIFRDQDENVDAYVGLGLRFDVEDDIRIAVEYESMDFKAALGAADTDHTINHIGVSLGVLF